MGSNRQLKFNTIIKNLVKAVFGIGVGFLFVSCASLHNDPATLINESVDTVSGNIKNKGYPNLLKIPQVSNSMKSEKQWQRHQVELEKYRDNFADTLAQLPPVELNPNLKWAEVKRDSLLKNPFAAPAVIDEDPAIWAARLRALMEQKYQQQPN